MMSVSWPCGGLPDEPPDSGDCDSDCAECMTDDCDVRGEECADPEACRDCAAVWCGARIEDNDNEEAEA